MRIGKYFFDLEPNFVPQIILLLFRSIGDIMHLMRWEEKGSELLVIGFCCTRQISPKSQISPSNWLQKMRFHHFDQLKRFAVLRFFAKKIFLPLKNLWNLLAISFPDLPSNTSPLHSLRTFSSRWTFGSGALCGFGKVSVYSNNVSSNLRQITKMEIFTWMTVIVIENHQFCSINHFQNLSKLWKSLYRFSAIFKCDVIRKYCWH